MFSMVKAHIGAGRLAESTSATGRVAGDPVGATGFSILLPSRGFS